MTPSEPHLLKQLERIRETLTKHYITLTFRPNTQFLISHEEFCKQYEKPPIMETFYRWMRKKFGILMNGDKPLGGKRNYDADNRTFDKSFIQESKQISYPTSRLEALALLEQFVMNKLDRFGALEDAMYTHNDTVYHSLLSTSINFGLLTPMEVIQAIT